MHVARNQAHVPVASAIEHLPQRLDVRHASSCKLVILLIPDTQHVNRQPMRAFSTRHPINHILRRVREILQHVGILSPVGTAQPRRERPGQPIKQNIGVARASFFHQLPFVTPMAVDIALGVFVAGFTAFCAVAIATNLDLQDLQRGTEREEAITIFIALLVDISWISIDISS